MGLFERVRGRDVVTLAAFPKSGVTYLSSLLFYSFFPEHGGNFSNVEREFVIDVHTYPYDDARTAFGNRYVKSHFSFGENPTLDRQTCKSIYLIRHPIDVMNSAFDFNRLLDPDQGAIYSEFVDKWIATGGGGFEFAGNWEGHVRSWLGQSEIPTILVRYPDLVDHPREQLSDVFKFLEVAPEQTNIEFAIENSSMAAMRAREEAEFASKTEGVFYNETVSKGMSQGARFINKGYRNSIAKLNDRQKVAADERFGPLIRQYLQPR